MPSESNSTALFRAAKLALVAILATWVGVGQVREGTRHGITAGVCALILATILWLMVANSIYALARRKSASDAGLVSETPPVDPQSPAVLAKQQLWIGLALTFLPLALYGFLWLAVEPKDFKPGILYVLGALFVPGGIWLTYKSVKELRSAGQPPAAY